MFPAGRRDITLKGTLLPSVENRSTFLQFYEAESNGWNPGGGSGKSVSNLFSENIIVERGRPNYQLVSSGEKAD